MMIQNRRRGSAFSWWVMLSGTLLLGSCKTYTCEDYRIGTFKYDDKSIDATVVRTANQQIESSDSLNYRDVFKIEWTGDCFYKMVLESTDNPARMPLSKYDTIFVKISEVDDKGYIFDAKFLDQIQSGKLLKLDDGKE